MEWLLAGVLASTILTQAWQGSKLPVMTSSTDFQLVFKTRAFVDKTLLLLELLSDGFPRPTLITVPQGFGKTTNLEMIRAFLSIPVDDKGHRINPNLTDIHATFTKTKLYNSNSRFFYQYFGKFPVLYVDLKTSNPVDSFEGLIDVLKQKIHYSFRRYSYLTENKDWMDKAQNKHFSKAQVLEGLNDLIDSLYRHFDDSKVVVLVDNYDSLVTAAMMTVENKQLNQILMEVFGLLTKITTNDHVQWTLVTGTLPIDCSDSDCLSNMDKYKFLDLQPFGEYFGFLEDEVMKLLQNSEFNLSEEETNKTLIMYKPYVALGGKQIFCPNSILKFLKKRKVEAFWEISFYLNNLISAYKDPELETTIDHLLKDKDVEVKLKKSFNNQDLMMLRSMFLGRGTTGHSGTEMLLSYMFHTGYLTRCSDPKKVKLPNHEIKETIVEYLWNAHTVDVSKHAPDVPLEI